MTTTMTSTMDLENAYTSGVYSKRPVVIVRGSGASLWDAEGREYIDCMAGHGVANIGHGRVEIADALAEQARRLITCPEIVYNDVRARLLERLARITPEGLEHIFLCNSGTEAIEGAFKFARLATGRTGIVATLRAFHGRSMGALSATWEPHYREPFAPLLPDVSHVRYNDLAAADAAINEGTAAVIIELVQGEGGVHVASEEYVRGLANLCRERGALLIIDEVQTGFGRTGQLFACSHYNVQPDILCLAKSLAGGVPMGAICLGPRVIESGRITKGVHGTTFGGNPLSCAAALATLDIIEREALPERAARLGTYVTERLLALNLPIVREVRGRGLLIGIELKKRVQPYLEALAERGVLALPAGPNVLRLLPPLVITEEQIDRVLTVLQEVLATSPSRVGTGLTSPDAANTVGTAFMPSGDSSPRVGDNVNRTRIDSSPRHATTRVVPDPTPTQGDESPDAINRVPTVVGASLDGVGPMPTQGDESPDAINRVPTVLKASLDGGGLVSTELGASLDREGPVSTVMGASADKVGPVVAPASAETPDSTRPVLTEELALLYNMLRIPSYSGEECALARFLVAQAQQMGLHAYVDEAGNFVASSHETLDAQPLVLLGHMDTVRGDIPVRIEDGLLYGRGAVDAKGPLAAFICATARVRASLQRPVVIVGAVEEEAATSRGARAVVERYRPSACIIGEPSGSDGVTIGYKGRLLVECVATRSSSHSAGPLQSSSEVATAFWERVRRSAEEWNQRFAPSSAFAALQPSLRAINSGHDGLEDCTRLMIGYRLPPNYDIAGLRAQLAQWADEADMQLSFSGEEAAFQATRTTPLARSFIAALRGQGIQPTFKYKTGTSDMNVVGPRWGQNIVAYGPGDARLDHTPQEHIRIDEYRVGIDVLSAVLQAPQGEH